MKRRGIEHLREIKRRKATFKEEGYGWTIFGLDVPCLPRDVLEKILLIETNALDRFVLRMTTHAFAAFFEEHGTSPSTNDIEGGKAGPMGLFMSYTQAIINRHDLAMPRKNPCHGGIDRIGRSRFAYRGSPYMMELSEILAMRGNLSMLKWVRECKLSMFDVGVCWMAASGGHLDVLKWLRSDKINVPWDGTALTCLLDAKPDTVWETFDWMFFNGCPPGFDLGFEIIAAGCSLDLLDRLYEGAFSGPIYHGPKSWVAAASVGRTDILDWLHARRFLMDGCDEALRVADGYSLTWGPALRRNDRAVLAWLKDRDLSVAPFPKVGSGAIFRTYATYGDCPITCAAKYGNAEMFQYFLFDKGASPTELTYSATCLSGNMYLVRLLDGIGAWDRDEDPFKWRLKKCLVMAAKEGHLDVIKYLVEERNLGWASKVVKAAWKAGHQHIIEWIAGKDYKWGEALHFHLIKRGDYAGLKRLKGLGKPILRPDSAYCWHAAAHIGPPVEVLKMLKWLTIVEKCPLGSGTTEELARRGLLGCLKWATSHGGPVGVGTLEAAIETGHFETAKWLKEKRKCALVFQEAGHFTQVALGKRSSNVRILGWLLLQGYPLRQSLYEKEVWTINGENEGPNLEMIERLHDKRLVKWIGKSKDKKVPQMLGLSRVENAPERVTLEQQQQGT